MHRMRTGIWCALAAVASLTGCYDDGHRRDVLDHSDPIAPGEPRDVFSVTGDGQVTVYWSPPRDADLAGFRVLVSRDDADYYRIADLPASQRHWVVRGSTLPAPVPFEFQNGTTYWFAVESVDDAGNRSGLSDVAVTSDTPRPAGRDLRLYDVNGPRRAESGYDFSRSPYGYALDGTSLFADLYYAWEGHPVLRSTHASVVELQNLGPMAMDDDRAGSVDESRWQAAAAVNLGIGDVILVKIYEETRPGNDVEPFNVAKIRVVNYGSDAVLLDWAYQIQPNSRELKPHAGAPSAAPGMAHRREVER